MGWNAVDVVGPGPSDDGSGYQIGDGFILTAGHVVFRFNGSTTNPAIVTNKITRQYRPYQQDYLDEVNRRLALGLSGTSLNPEVIEGDPEVYRSDSVVIEASGSVNSQDQGLIVFLNENDLADAANALAIPTTIRMISDSHNKIATIASAANGLLRTSDVSIPGDSGGAFVIEAGEKAFVIGTVSGDGGDYNVVTYFRFSEWTAINLMLAEGQIGDVTNSEPTNMIVGSTLGEAAEGSFRPDVILGREGNDILNDGDSAQDIVYADDQLFGGAGDDRLIVGAGHNLIHGGDFREYGGSRVPLAADGEDTADFGGSTNGIEIRFPALNAGDPANSGNPAIDKRYKQLLGDDFNSALFVKSRTFKLSNEPAFTNTLVSIEKIMGSDVSDILYLDELPTTVAATGGISEIDFAGESARGYPGGDVIVLGPKVATSVSALLSNKQAQTISGATSISFKNAESIITTKFDDEIFAAEGGFVIAGAGDDKIHLRAGTFAVGGEGADKFYVKTKYDGSSASFDNDVFILDFNPDEDELYVDGVLFDGYRKHTRYGSIALGTAQDGFTHQYWGQYLVDQMSGTVDTYGNVVPQSTSSFGLQGLDIKSQSVDDLLGGGAAYENGKIREVTVASLAGSTTIDDFGRVQFIDADVEIGGSNGSYVQDGAVNWSSKGIPVLPGFSLNNFLNLHIGKFWHDGQNAFSHTIQGQVETSDGTIYGVDVDSRKGNRALFGSQGDNQAPMLRVVQGTDRYGLPRAEIVELTGFNADSNVFSINQWSDKATVDVILSTELTGVTGASSFNANTSSPIANDSFSFIYDGRLKVTLPVDLTSLDFASSYSELEHFDLSPNAISSFSNTLGLRDLGVLPHKSESVSGALQDGRAKIAGDLDETLEGTDGSDILIGGAGNNTLVAENAFNGSQNDILIGGAGNDEYHIGGAFDKSVVAERFDANSNAGGQDKLHLDFASTSVVVVEGNNPEDVKLVLPIDSNGGYNPILTIANQLSSNSEEWIEEIHFSDGVVWTRQDLIEQIISAAEFGGLLGVSETSISFLEDEAFIHPLSDFFTDTLRREVNYSLALGDGSPAPDWLSLYQDPHNGESYILGNMPENYIGEIDLRITGSVAGEQVTVSLHLTIDPVNDAPTAVATLDDVVAEAGQQTSIVIPSAIFEDVDGDSLTIELTLADGSPVPSWITFDGATLHVQAPTGLNQTLDVKVVASDGELSAEVPFALTIVAANEILGTAGNDQISGTNAADHIYGYAGADTIDALDGADVIDGGAGNDQIIAGQGDDVVNGGDGDDVIHPGAGADILDGGTQGWVDYVSYQYATSAVQFSLISGGTLGDAQGDQYVSIEAARGSDFDDSIEGNNVNNWIDGRQGVDVIHGLNGDDRLDGGQGADTIYGDAGNDWLYDGNDNSIDVMYGGTGRDYLAPSIGDIAYGGDNDDTFSLTKNSISAYGDSGDDAFEVKTNLSNLTIDGGVGFDSIALYVNRSASILNIASIELIWAPTDGTNISSILSSSTILDLSAVALDGTLDLKAGTNSNTWLIAPQRYAGSDPDVLRMFGAAGNDTLTGSSYVESIFGNAGDDNVEGRAGDDLIIGGAGTDTMVLMGLQSSYSIATVNGNMQVIDNQQLVDGNDGTDTVSGIEILRFKDGSTVNITSPIILDLDGNGVRTVSAAESHARYDLDGDGLADDTSWFGNTEGMLFLDRDGNGTVSNAGEFSFIDDVASAKSDLDGLRAFDSNKDGLLSSLDAKFAEFKIWQDRDSDGVAEAGEILSLTQANVRSIRLAGTAVNGTTQFGDVAVVNKGSYTRSNGTTMEFLDAALTYFSSATSMSSIEVQEQRFARKADKYKVTISGGAMTLAPKKGQSDPRAGALLASNLMTFKGKSFGLISPIILDLDGDGIEMASIKKSKAAFDMNGDGVADDTGWTGKGDGFLVIDRNNDGKITHASELSFAVENKNASSDLEALAALDNNGDRVLNKQDSRFGELKVWVDANGNGVTEIGELNTLSELGITEIGLAGRNIDGTAKVGDNVLISTATFTRENGSISTLGNAALAYRPGSISATIDDIAGSNSRFTLPERVVSEDAEFEPGAIVDQAIGARAATERSAADQAAAILRGGNAGSRFALPQIDMLTNSRDVVNIFDYYEQPDASMTTGITSGNVPTTLRLADLVDAPMLTQDLPVSLQVTDFENLLSHAGDPLDPSARLVALMVQDMSAFGAKSGENDLSWRRDGAMPVDYFA